MKSIIASVGLFALLPATALAATLPLRDGKYTQTMAPCSDAPMSVSTVIWKGKEVEDPQLGVCTTALKQIGTHEFLKTGHCTQDQLAKSHYKILGNNKFQETNEFGSFVFRYCGPNK
jgi:hypothetical protein